jgi:hypothetical protein
MNAARSISPSDLRQPTDYKAKYERAEHQRMQLADKVKRLELERDGLLFRLQNAEAKLRRQDTQAPAKQTRLPLAAEPGSAIVA